jgi:hypothetical protein
VIYALVVGVTLLNIDDLPLLVEGAGGPQLRILVLYLFVGGRLCSTIAAVVRVSALVGRGLLLFAAKHATPQGLLLFFFLGRVNLRHI